MMAMMMMMAMMTYAFGISDRPKFQGIKLLRRNMILIRPAISRCSHLHVFPLSAHVIGFVLAFLLFPGVSKLIASFYFIGMGPGERPEQQGMSLRMTRPSSFSLTCPQLSG